jgi:hopanoid biosynthesis associated radical SAM protein HpnH
MSVPISQMWSISSYVLRQRLAGRRRYPIVLMLEPLFRCNLACAGCGKIQYPTHLLRTELTPDQCFAAVDECPAPVVSIPGGEPLLHPQIREIVEGLIERRKWIYLCTNAVLLKEKLEAGWFRPDKHLVFSVHLDGLEEHHDFAVCREGVYEKAIESIREAVSRGFRVTTNTTLFEGADPNAVRDFFDEAMALGVEGLTISPGYAYEAAPDQEAFLARQETHRLFDMVLSNRRKSWRFNQSPLFLEFLMGRRSYECSPWGSATYNLFGWQKPCYLLQDGFADTFEQLMSETAWSEYGRASGNPKCQNCMVHCGYEPTAVADSFSGVRGMVATIRAMLSRYRSTEAAAALAEEAKKPHGPLVQLGLDQDLSRSDERTTSTTDAA